MNLQQALDKTLRPILGDNLDAYYAEVERHQQELREIPDRLERELLDAVAEVMDPEEVNALRVECAGKIRDAMLAEHQEHRKRADALLTKHDTANGPLPE